VHPLRIFISSPGDVQLERQIARRVIARLQSEFGDQQPIEPYFWEYEPMRLTKDFQAQIPRTSSFDIVVCILWSRLGSPLGASHLRGDGTQYQSGTEFEFEHAAKGFRARGVPDILVYRNQTDPQIRPRPKEERERQLAQFDALEAFLDRWTREGDIFKGALNTYSDVAQFEELLGEHLRKLIAARCPLKGASEAARAAAWTQGSPFRGLEPFEFEHSTVFRGRTRAVQDVIGLVRRQYLARQSWTPSEGHAPPIFVLVSAMSGIGKSSLIRAGVLPLLTAPGVIEGIGLWRRAVIKPTGGAGLFNALSEALTAPDALPELLADGSSAAEVADRLKANPSAADLLLKGGLSQAAAKLKSEEEARLRQWEAEFSAAGRTADAERCRTQRQALQQREAALVLFVDQLEEIFTATDKSIDAEREAFLAVLDTLARSKRVVVLATLRSDFFARATETALLATMANEGALYQLEPPTVSEIAQIIRDPAREAGLTFEEDAESGSRLDDVLLAATEHDPAALPLLEFTLEQLYQRRDPNGRMTHKAYNELNGVEGALALRAEEEFARLGADAKAAFGGVFSALVNLTDIRDEERPVRRRASVSELSSRPGAGEFVDRFARARLLVLDHEEGGSTVSVVHEALFSYWGRLRDWIEQNRDLLRVRARIELAAARWDKDGRPRDLLLPDGRLLAEAQDLVAHSQTLALKGPVIAFVQQSTAAQATRRRRRMAAAAIIAAGVAIAGAVGWQQKQALDESRIQAKLLEYRQAVGQAQSAFMSQGPDLTSRQQALARGLRVFELSKDIASLRGSPPDTADLDAVRVYEFTAIARAGLGDAEGSLRDFELRKKLLESLPESQKALAASAVELMSPFAIRVLDLNLEKAIAEIHLKLLTAQNAVLKAALAQREAEDAGNPAPPVDMEKFRPEKEKIAREGLLAYSHYVRLLEYVIRENPREHHFFFLALLQTHQVGFHEDLRQANEAQTTRENMIATQRRRLEWAKTASLDQEERPRAVYRAGTELAKAQEALASHYLRVKDFERALASARAALQTLETEPALKSSEDQRFAVRKLVASALASQGQSDAALSQAEAGAGAVLTLAQDNLRASWKAALRKHREIATYWNKEGRYSRAVEVARQRVAELEQLALLPFGAADDSDLHDGYLTLSWHLLFARQFADAAAAAKKGLGLSLSPERQALLYTNLAHALLFEGLIDQAREIYETWKDKLIGKDELFAAAILEDFKEFERAGMVSPEIAAIRSSMQAVVDAQSKGAKTKR
jgi:hypothetical protein